MISPRRALAALLAIAALTATPAGADEGQWMPEQIADLDHDALRRRGLELRPEELWDPAGGGLMRAAVNLSGCSASFISPEGLVITNHHCAYGALQAASTVERDLLKDGFLARTRAEEEPARGRSVRVVEQIDDVTEAIKAAAAAAPDDRARARAVRAKIRELVAACDAAGVARRCEVASFFGGSMYRQIAYLEIPDVRLVYAPPSSIGEFGGEIDNWMWPRHTGDFTILRAYVGPDGTPRAHDPDNLPYRPARWLRLAPEGVQPGDLVAVLGYPGRTTRYLWVAELTRTLDQTLPALIDLYGEWIAIAEELGAADPAVAIKVAATKKSLANRHKNSRGMIDGVKAMGLRERREAEEARLREGEGAALLADLAEYSADARARYPTAFALHRFAHAPSLVDAAVSLVRWARERQRPERERADGYLERDRDDLWNGIARRLRDHDVEVEAHLLAAVLARAAALPPTENARVDALAGLIAGKRGDRQVFLPATRRLLKGTRLADAEAMRGLFDAADPAALRASRDPLLVLANALVDAIERDEAEEESRRGRRMVLEPAYFELLRGVRPGPLYPDANGTLRFSVATVRGYRPRDGLEALPQTTLRGQLAKLTGAEPFTLPERVVAAAAGAAESYWADPGLADLVLCLLADGDTTGGNSGSAVVNGRGEVIGLNFDRVWENIAGDVAYSNERSRNIIVDVRYLLWLLDRVEDAGALLDELGVGDRRGKPRRPAPKDSKEGPAPSPSMVTTIEGPRGEGPRGEGQDEDGARGAGARASEAGCACASAPLRGLGPLLLGALALGLRRRR